MSEVHEIDARRLLCPMPVIRLQDAIAELPLGSVVRITCTDPGVQNDIPAWCRINGQRLDGIEQRGNEFLVTVTKTHDD
jgi:tRNA 2-thiouridine synthesizing protein A